MRIHALECGRVKIKQTQVRGRGHGFARRLAPLFDREWTDWLPIYAYAVEHRDGVIVVDTGGNAGLMDLPWHPYFRNAVRFDVEPEKEIGPRLAALGIGPHDVRSVVLTHLHIDHDGGLAHFRNNEILVAPGEIAAASGLKGRIGGYLPQRWPAGFDPKPLTLAHKAFGPFARSRPLTADGTVVVIATPGHTPNHLSVAVDTGEGWALLVGDATYTQASLDADIVDGVSPDEVEARATLADLRAFAARRPVIVLPAHDPEVPARLAAWNARAAQPPMRAVNGK